MLPAMGASEDFQPASKNHKQETREREFFLPTRALFFLPLRTVEGGFIFSLRNTRGGWDKKFEKCVFFVIHVALR